MEQNIHAKIAFVGFGEVNTPREVLVEKCKAAVEELQAANAEVNVITYPVTDKPDESEIREAINMLRVMSSTYDSVVICIAGWIPSHAVTKITEQIKDKPMVLWGLCGEVKNGKVRTTADQAGTTALRYTFSELGYTFKYFYNIIGMPSRANDIVEWCKAATVAAELRKTKVGMMGYRDMNLWGTLYDGLSLKKKVGVEIETFEMLEVKQRFDAISAEEKRTTAENLIEKEWKFTSPANPSAMYTAAGYYMAVRDIINERGYEAVSLKDVDGMKKLLGFPPAPIFMLLANNESVCTVPENDSLGAVTQVMMKYLTGQCSYYLEFYEFMEDRVLAGVPDYVPAEVTDGPVTIMPAAFGELDQGLLCVSKVKPGDLTMCRLGYVNGKYVMHALKGQGVTPRPWEEIGWDDPAPQLPSLEIIMDDVPDFAEKVLAQHYIITYGDNMAKIKALCDILGIEMI